MSRYSFLVIAIAAILMVACKQQSMVKETALQNLKTTANVVEPDTAQALTTIAFGSCNNQNQPQPLWQPILGNDPDLWVWLGDNIYGDTHDMRAMQGMYAKQKSNPGYQSLLQEVPVIGIWDDHDYGINDGGKNYTHKQKSRDLMLEFLDVSAEDPIRNREGGYTAYTFGPEDKQVKIILLDTRYFRDTLLSAQDGKKRYAPNAEGDILGKTQWQWLEYELKNSKASINIIGSSIQVISEEHGYEKWANFPKSRQMLFDLIANSGAQGIVFLSGDRHIAEISRYQIEGMAYPVYDITSSGLTHVWEDAEEGNQHRVGDLVTALNFGIITIDWDKKPLEVTYQIKGENNREFLQETVQYQ